MSRYGRMRASFDSDASLVNSPPLSPPRHGHPVYFVQSPSRDSLDSSVLSQSFSRDSPSASPLHPQLKQQHHAKHPSTDSTSSSQLPFTPLRPGSRRVLPQPSHLLPGKKGGLHRPGTILEGEEEGVDGERKRGISRVCLVWIAVCFTVVAFFVGSLLFWAVTMPKAPHVTVQGMAFSYFGLEEGVDNSGVPTLVVSLNSTATLQLYNPSKFFGYHVKGSPMGLKYLDLSMAEGQMTPFYLEKRSRKKVTVSITTDKQFLHGAGPSFDQSYSAPGGGGGGGGGGGVVLKMEGTIFTRAYVMGQMLKNKFSNNVACTFNFAAGPPTQWKVQQLACIYA